MHISDEAGTPKNEGLEVVYEIQSCFILISFCYFPFTDPIKDVFRLNTEDGYAFENWSFLRRAFLCPF